MSNHYTTLCQMMIANGTTSENFEIWSNGNITYGFADSEGMHFCSSEEARDQAKRQAK
jgi:hypothetical protein